ncbi:hypothetical protein [Anaerocolumna xylanovorans]|uniref:Uncharacterized protein n=1 Tax=Anaerocolumna xylanovorans DSM 12503 TaxID=1121345 RepID=A0A1M7Y9T3_9FIRM|nr:hypothetical protein [Anaerocolumna xylanovorans]SHO49392.1 hypothetical protein SAMN02745217_02284 [Anaerocolumna xylanovorans DSM 12503]
MKRKIYKKYLYMPLLVIVLIMGLGYGYLKYRYEKQEMPHIVFMQNNRFGREYEYGSFIDNQGNVYEFKAPKEDRMDEKEKYRYLEENYLNTSAESKVVRKVELDKLKKCYSLVKKASNFRIKLTENHPYEDVYMGDHEWFAFRYNLFGQLQVVTLYGTGDWEVVNKSRYAKKAAKLAQEMLPEIPRPED